MAKFACDFYSMLVSHMGQMIASSSADKKNLYINEPGTLKVILENLSRYARAIESPEMI